MKECVELVAREKLLEESQEALNARKEASLREGTNMIGSADAGIYIRSLYKRENVLYLIARTAKKKALLAIADQAVNFAFTGTSETHAGLSYQVVELTKENAPALHALFPFTKPVSLRDRRTTIGMGDRLGKATAGHIRAARKYQVAPVLAQQSIRELDFTDRDFAEVVADASFAVFEEGYEEGYGADGDHLKNFEAIDTALAEHMPMVTLDLTEVMKPDVADWAENKVEDAFNRLPDEFRDRVKRDFFDASFRCGEHTITIPASEAKLCAVMYGPALDFSEKVNRHVKKKTNDTYDLEISIDETTTPTLPEHHVFIARELQERGVMVNSLAPRFVGEFQKAIDYIGDIDEFERQFAVHCAIAREFGGYKISVHSGSDKFSVYPAVGKHTGHRLHLKTAGTSWLESIRVIARKAPDLYRTMHTKAIQFFPEALKYYRITADIETIPAPESVPDEKLESLLEIAECRQLLHVSYGGLLSDPAVRSDFFATLHREEESYYNIIEAHFDKHISLLGVPRKKQARKAG